MSADPAPAPGACLARLGGERRPELLRDELLHEIFQCTATQRPDQVAVRSGRAAWTYSALAQRAEQAARYLRSLGVGRGSRVVLRMSRGPDTYVALLAILKAGGTYVPADPEWPVERVRFVIEDAGAAFVVSDRAVDNSGLSCRLVYGDELPGSAGAAAAVLTRAETGLTPDDAAYVIYTSGSTGRPKGVMVTHRSICHFVRAEGAVLALRPDDSVFQGASLAFDMSLEEIWPTWAAGATLLAGTRDMLRAGGDLAALLAQAGVTVWTAVPTLIALQEARIPSLRLLNVGGEACPPELVRQWARPGLRLLNTYGPTEATITATWAELAPDRPVTIGRPLPNYSAYVVRTGDEADAADSGELWIGGPGVALGYLGRPELTAAQFVRNAFAAGPDAADPVLYRTGDRVRATAGGELAFLGRIDTQVKIRGYRVELAEIESVLLAVDGLKQAAVTVHADAAGGEMLVAYVVPRAGAACDEAGWRRRLRERLPAYMVPAVFELLPSLPLQTSGKVDRKNLPPPRCAPPPRRSIAAPSTVTERCIHSACTDLFRPAAVSIDADFFFDLGGHSLRAAALVSALRRHAALRHVSMADVYQHPTIRRLAAHLDASRPAAPADRPRAPSAEIPRRRYVVCAVAQALGLVLVYGLFSLQWLIPYLAYAWLYNQEELARSAAMAISVGLFLAAIPVMLVVGIAAKWLILGRLRPGTYPLWGFTYYRWWLTQRLLDTVPIEYLGGSPLLGLYYRLLGARIGPGVLLHGASLDAPDCISVDAGTTVAAGAAVCACHVEGGKLQVGAVRLGRDCYIGASSVVARETTIGDGAELGDLSMLPRGRVVPPGERWSGSPAGFERRVARGAVRRESARRRRGFGALYVALLLVFPVFAVLPILPGMVLMTELDQNTDAYAFVLLSPLLALGFVVSMCLQIAALKWVLVGRVRPRQMPVLSFAYVRHWLVDQFMKLSLDVVNPLYASLYLNPWYRLLGVKLGRRAEVSTASSISYDLLAVGEESFVADAVSLGAPRVDQGVLTLDRTTLGRRAFVGNSAVIPSATAVGDGVLVGVLSLPPADPAEALRPNTSWFGSPAVFLPQRQVVTRFGEGSTFRPSRRLVAQRLAIEFARILLPLTVVIALTSLLMSFVVDLDDAGWSISALVLVFPFLYLLYAIAAAAVVLGVKWMVVGRYRAVEKPLWSPFVWRSELVTSAYESLAVPLFAEQLRGTPFLAAYLRLLGCKIGRRVFLDTTDFTEFDLVAIGDDAALNQNCGPQTHLFEDRVMKISSVDIGARCVVGAGSIVLYDTRMEDDSTLGELSMLMKGETLPAGTSWEGSPARPRP